LANKNGENFPVNYNNNIFSDRMKSFMTLEGE